VLPAPAEIEALISQARLLRLKLVELTSFEALSESAKDGVESLSRVGLQLEHIIELVVSARTRSRRRRRKEASSVI
jgi:hypothetical protein